MCGISGYFGTRPPNKDAEEKCLQLMGRRGPDFAAAERFEHGDRQALLIHSRLSIIDLDARANQPMTVGNTTGIINGEIYNYIELRHELEKQGCSLATKSDTEVFFRLLDQKGVDALDRVEGMWAFAAWDQKSKSLTLSRDRFAEKPLFIFRTPHGLYFGSEPKFIFALMERRPDVNTRQIKRFIVNGYRSIYKTEDMFFDGLQELGAGKYLTITSTGIETENKYWAPSYRPNESMSFQDAVDGVREKLVRALEIRLRADVPLAFLLSGGVDSNSLVGIAKRHFNRDVSCYTLMNEDDRYDEWPVVQETVKELDLRHCPVPITSQNFLENLDTVIRQHDAPIYTITYYVQWLLMNQISEDGFRIVLSGTGADELLTGYYDYYLLHLAELINTPFYDQALLDWDKFIKPEVRNPYLSNANLFVERPECRDYIYLDQEVFEDYLIGGFHEDFEENTYSSSMLRNRMMNELFDEGVRVSLHEEDLNAMYYSIENRAPFLDRGLFDFCYSIPSRHLIKDGYNKSVLRQAMRGLASTAVLDSRRKVGFNAPVLSFVDPTNSQVRDRLLADGPIFDLVKRDRIEKMFQTDGDLPNSASKFLFNFINVRMFMDQCA